MTNRQLLTPWLWVCTVMPLLGTGLTVLPTYRNAFGVVRTPADLLIRCAPGILCAALHAYCAVRRKGCLVRVCGVFDITIGATGWIPWAGIWLSMFSPFSIITIVAAHASAGVLIATYVGMGIATLGTGAWIIVADRSPTRCRPPEA